jgi:hypothetical protein
MDQIVKHHWHPDPVPKCPAPIQKDHEGSRFRGIILRRDVNRIVVRRSRIVLSRWQNVLGHHPLRHALCGPRIRSEWVLHRKTKGNRKKKEGGKTHKEQEV